MPLTPTPLVPCRRCTKQSPRSRKQKPRLLTIASSIAISPAVRRGWIATMAPDAAASKASYPGAEENMMVSERWGLQHEDRLITPDRSAMGNARSWATTVGIPMAQMMNRLLQCPDDDHSERLRSRSLGRVPGWRP